MRVYVLPLKCTDDQLRESLILYSAGRASCRTSNLGLGRVLALILGWPARRDENTMNGTRVCVWGYQYCNPVKAQRKNVYTTPETRHVKKHIQKKMCITRPEDNLKSTNAITNDGCVTSWTQASKCAEKGCPNLHPICVFSPFQSCFQILIKKTIIMG